MKISLDGGALCCCSNQRFGNYVFTKNFIQAIRLYDNDNLYFIYSFCPKPRWFREDDKIYYQNLQPKKFWMNLRVSFEELFCKKEIFLAVNQSIPFYTQAKIISFCLGLSFYFYPKFYSDSYKNLKNQLETMIKKSSWIIVSSKKVKKELSSVFQQVKKKIKVLPYGIPFDMRENSKFKIQNSKLNNNFFLFVGMNHPIKNIGFIKKAFTQFKRDKNYKNYKLYLITKNISRERLKQLYRQATALLTASFYESFNFPVLEALLQGCPVIGLKSAIIPELSEFVTVVNNLEEFVKRMKKIALEQRRISITKIQKINKMFNWKNYVFNLKKLYHS